MLPASFTVKPPVLPDSQVLKETDVHPTDEKKEKERGEAKSRSQERMATGAKESMGGASPSPPTKYS